MEPNKHASEVFDLRPRHYGRVSNTELLFLSAPDSVVENADKELLVAEEIQILTVEKDGRPRIDFNVLRRNNSRICRGRTVGTKANP